MKRILIALVSVMVMMSSVVFFLHQRKIQTIKSQEEHSVLKIVTTNSILEDMVENIVQDKGEVYSIVKRGVDPHEYEPQPEDITQANDADLLFHNGLNLETGGNGWFKKLVETAHKEFDKEVFSASETVSPLHLTTNVKEEDPHAWLDLANGMKYVATMSEKIQQKDPKNALYYQQNTKKYLNQLAELHEKAQTIYLEIPENKRLLVTSEGAFKYFAKAYQVTPTYIWEINTESQGTPEQMKAVLKKIKASKINHLFVETSVSPKSMEQVAKETGLDIYATIFTDSLGKKGSLGDTYYTMMKWNIEKIYEGLVK